MAFSWLRNERVNITSVRLMTTVWTMVLSTIRVVSSTNAGSFTPGHACSYLLSGVSLLELHPSPRQNPHQWSATNSRWRLNTEPRSSGMSETEPVGKTCNIMIFLFGKPAWEMNLEGADADYEMVEEIDR